MVVFIENKLVKVGIDENRGGAISHISKQGCGKNIINTWDTGRLLQQSYYGNSDGSSWNGKPWRWNPVQGGSWDNQPAQLISVEKVLGDEPCLITKCHPRNWGGCQVCTDVVMTTTIKLKSCGTICVECSMTYSGSEKHGKSVQEIPACFLDPRFSVLVYRNTKTKDVMKVIPNPPGSKNMQKHADPTWAGYVDPATNEGVFISSPNATSLTAYRVDIPTNPRDSNCSYLAPLLDNYAVKSNSTITYSYSVALQSFDVDM